MKTKTEWNGKDIQVSSRHIGIDTPSWGGGCKKHHFKIMVECDGNKFTEEFWQSDDKMSVRGLRGVLENLCMEATYGDMSIDDFNSELCYEKGPSASKPTMVARKRWSISRTCSSTHMNLESTCERYMTYNRDWNKFIALQ